jgi:hypothetical protein
LSELTNALLRSIAQHGQVELIEGPTIKLTIQPTINTHQYTIQADCNLFDDMPINIQSKPIAIAAITIIGCAFISHLAIYAGCLNPLIVLWSIAAIATLLFFAIHWIAHMSTHKRFQA